MGPKITFSIIARSLLVVSAACAIGPFGAQAQSNGIGADPDGDSNPATDVYGFYQKTADAAPEIDSLFEMINFEPPPGKHNEVLRAQYKSGFGVSFSRGLMLQECDGQQYFEYDSRCTYMAPASGKYAAVYHDDFRRPLRMRFDEPVCATALSIYPVGGREGERFRVKIDLYETLNDGEKTYDRMIDSVRVDYTWTKNTFRWRSKAIAFMESGAADRVDVSIRSRERKRRKKNIDFLIDDLAYVPHGSGGTSPCADALASVMAASDYKPVEEDDEEEEE